MNTPKYQVMDTVSDEFGNEMLQRIGGMYTYTRALARAKAGSRVAHVVRAGTRRVVWHKLWTIHEEAA